MTAEEQALKAYPNIKIGEQRIDQSSAREVYVEGYQRAQQDLMEKAKQWFTDYIPSEKVQLLWCEFEQFITE
jgi:hypothetical protein